MKALKSSFLFIGLALVFLGFSSIYIVHEGQHAILVRVGKMVVGADGKPLVLGPGIHFKIPFIEKNHTFDTRLKTLTIDSSRIVTAEKKDVLVDYYAKWRIDNLPLYYTRTDPNPIQAQALAETLLRQKLNDGLRAQFGKRNISEVVSGERTDIMSILKKNANEGAKSLGMTVIDVRIKAIDLPKEVSSAVYDRMRAERERVATEHRADGKSAAEAVRAAADADVTVTLATAHSKGKRTRGEGDATAAKIYADAYKKDPDFFAFYRSLRAYVDVFKNKRDMLVLRPDSQFFKYFNHMKAVPKTHQ